MDKVRKKFEEKGFDLREYERYFHLHPSEYIRKRLRSLRLYAEGLSAPKIGEKINFHPQSVRKCVQMYLSGGFLELCQPTVRPQKSRLTKEQLVDFKNIIIEKKPFDVGLEGNIWTGKLMRDYLEKTYGISYQSGIYNLLARMNLTHQKAHADYGNAKKEDQIVYLKELKNSILEADEQTVVLKYDEFSISEKPTSYYGWAEKNTRPKVITNEKKGKERMDF